MLQNSNTMDILTNNDDFMYKWTALYSSNFNSKHLQNFNFNHENYSGKPIQIKLAQFRLDWKRNQRKSEPQHVSVIIRDIIANIKPQS